MSSNSGSESGFSDITPEGNLNLAYLCGSVTRQEMDRPLKHVARFPWNGSKSGELEQPAVEKLLDLKPTKHPELYAAKHSILQLPRVQSETLS